MSRRILHIGSAAYPLANIARVQSQVLGFKRWPAVRAFIVVTVLWITLGAAAMALGGIAELRYGVRAEQRTLEDIADLPAAVGALSGTVLIDSLGIGFSILYIGVPLAVSLVCIGVVSATSTALGLTLGGALGARAEASAATWGGIILIATGIAFAVLKLFFSEL